MENKTILELEVEKARREVVDWIERQAWHYCSETSDPDGYYIPFEVIEYQKKVWGI